MAAMVTGSKAWLLGSALLLSCPLLTDNAEAARHGHHGGGRASTSLHVHPVSARMAWGLRPSHALHMAGHRYAVRSYGISCVPYAREVSGIQVAGNAWQWWDNAQGLYARGDRPETGSVLNFRANGRMHLGHVAVVTQVVNAREVIVDQANWPSGMAGYGGVSHHVTVVDVSEANNWSAVRVELGHEGQFGSIYPTYGFIYNRPDTGAVMASVARPAPQPVINRVPSDLRPVAERPWHTVEEVAELPSTLPRRLDLRISDIITSQ